METDNTCWSCPKLEHSSQWHDGDLSADSRQRKCPQPQSNLLHQNASIVQRTELERDLPHPDMMSCGGDSTAESSSFPPHPDTKAGTRALSRKIELESLRDFA